MRLHVGRRSALLAIVALSATALVGCAGGHTTSTKRPTYIGFSVAGVGHSDSVTYIKTPGNWDSNAAPPATVLSNHPRLPYHATRRITNPRTGDRYTINAGLVGPGHLSCTIQSGGASETGHIAGFGRDVGVLCDASLVWSARLGRLVRLRLFPIPVPQPSVDTTGIPRSVRAKLRGNRVMLLSPARVAFMTNGSSHCGWWPVWLTVLGHSKIQIDMRDHGRVAACGASGARVPIAVWINPQSLAVHRPLTVEFTYKEGAKQWHRTIVVQGIRAGRP